MVVAVLWVKVAELIPGPAAMSTAIMKGRLVVTAEGRGEGMQQRDAGDGPQHLRLRCVCGCCGPCVHGKECMARKVLMATC